MKRWKYSATITVSRTIELPDELEGDDVVDLARDDAYDHAAGGSVGVTDEIDVSEVTDV